MTVPPNKTIDQGRHVYKHHAKDDSDDLNYLAGKSFEQINDSAYRGTLLAHLDGGVPASTITIESRSALALGQLFYFFEKAVALTGYLLRINPFDQPNADICFFFAPNAGEELIHIMHDTNLRHRDTSLSDSRLFTSRYPGSFAFWAGSFTSLIVSLNFSHDYLERMKGGFQQSTYEK
jgi:hypothetical protein